MSNELKDLTEKLFKPHQFCKKGGYSETKEDFNNEYEKTTESLKSEITEEELEKIVGGNMFNKAIAMTMIALTMAQPAVNATIEINSNKAVAPLNKMKKSHKNANKALILGSSIVSAAIGSIPAVVLLSLEGKKIYDCNKINEIISRVDEPFESELGHYVNGIKLKYFNDIKNSFRKLEIVNDVYCFLKYCLIHMECENKNKISANFLLEDSSWTRSRLMYLKIMSPINFGDGLNNIYDAMKKELQEGYLTKENLELMLDKVEILREELFKEYYRENVEIVDKADKDDSSEPLCKFYELIKSIDFNNNFLRLALEGEHRNASPEKIKYALQNVISDLKSLIKLCEERDNSYYDMKYDAERLLELFEYNFKDIVLGDEYDKRSQFDRKFWEFLSELNKEYWKLKREDKTC